jgi:hypothetical protein
MYDSVNPGALPAGPALVAGYVDGSYAWPASGWQLWRDVVCVRISMDAALDQGDVLDVERGDASPFDAVGWVLRRRGAGADPSVYCNEATWPTVRALFTAMRVAEPHWWIASWPGGGPVLLERAVAHQYSHGNAWDTSVVANYWPGVDPPSPFPAPSVPPGASNRERRSDDMTVFEFSGQLHTVSVDPAGLLTHRWFTPLAGATAPTSGASWQREVLGRNCIPGGPTAVDLTFNGSLHVFAAQTTGTLLHCWYPPGGPWASEVLP